MGGRTLEEVGARLDKPTQPRKNYVYLKGSRFEVTPDGLYYCPGTSGQKKHDCPDCYFCQVCSNLRCSQCRDEEKLLREKGLCPLGR